MTGFMKSLWQDESGATAVEYGLMVALIAVAIVVAVGAVGGQLSTLFGNVRTSLGGAAS
jgi:pilus assembly protein Flp/PilA